MCAGRAEQCAPLSDARHTLDACADEGGMTRSLHPCDAGAEEVAVAEHRLVSVEELRSAAAVGERLRDTADVDPDEDLLVALAAHDGAALIAVDVAERAALRGVHLEDGILAELDAEEHARGSALADGPGAALAAPADCLHIASNRGLHGDQLGGSDEIDGASKDQIRDVELAESVREIEVALRDGMKIRMRMPLDDLDERAGADVARPEGEGRGGIGDAVSGGDDDARRDERRAARDLARTPRMSAAGSSPLLYLFAALLPLVPACREAKADPPVPSLSPPSSASASAPAFAPALASAPAPAPAPARVDRLPVPGDLPASLVPSLDGTPPTTVFLPGLCSNAHAYLQAFPEAARRQGGVVAIDGDQPCGALKDFRSFSWDATKLHARIEAATTAAGLAAVPKEGLTLVGYSQGAALAEQLVQRWPSRYSRIVLIGAPTDPSATRFAEARGIVTMSCSRDVPGKMKEATKRFVRAGIPSTYVEMPDCTHGNITDGDRTFDAAFSFLRDSSRPSL